MTKQVFGNSMLPLYRHGDQLVISVSGMADLNSGDRVALILKSGDWVAGTLLHCTETRIDLARGGSPSRGASFDLEDVAVFGRIIWASQ